jgi:arabinofuranan 3-O-arabinosyltransferase
MKRRPGSPTTAASLVVYLVLVALAMFEQWGRVTHDTKTPLITDPGDFLASSFSFWRAGTGLGEIQNQAYGYLFPQGPFFLLGEALGAAPWVTERLWSVLVVVVGAEGARRVARELGLAAWPAWVAGMAYGLNPRVIAEFTVRSAEILPSAALPWAVLPVVMAARGRLAPGRAALFSAAAYTVAGSVNGTATGAPLLLVVVLLVWAWRRGMLPGRMVLLWFGWTSVVNLWWVASLLQLNSFSPPFFDYVEDAGTTTATTGFATSLRGLSNWVNFIPTGSHATWPAGYSLAYDPWLAGATLLAAGIGLLGLVTWRAPWRVPLVVSVVVGLVCLQVGHESAVQSPLAPFVREQFDGVFALLRNVHKVDPVLRLPLCVGVGAAVAALLTWSTALPGRRRRVRPSLVRSLCVASVVLLVFASAMPVILLRTRTPGWERYPDHWTQAADFLASAPGQRRAWVVPGAGFGIQEWGWTQDEPMASVASTPWVARTQVPLAPPTTLRMLSRLELLLATGAGAPGLDEALQRLGVGYVVVRHDLERSLAEATSSATVSLALARSPGLARVATFGQGGIGTAIEIYRVGDEGSQRPDFSAQPLEETVTVAGSSDDVVDAAAQGLVDGRQPVVVLGDSGWEEPADVVGDAFQLRARNFGRVHDSEGPVLAVDEPSHSSRVVQRYPANEAGEPVVAQYYGGLRYADASSSQAFPDEFGGTRPENAPFAAVDEDLATAWRSAYYREPVGQWLELELTGPTSFGHVTVRTPGAEGPVVFTSRWEVRVGSERRVMEVDPFTGVGSVDMAGVQGSRVRFTALAVQGDVPSAAVAISEVELGATAFGRSLRVPTYPTTDHPVWTFVTRAPTRACLPTLLGAECSVYRQRSSEESAGMDRVIDVPATGTWGLAATAVARATPEAAGLLYGDVRRVATYPSSILAGSVPAPSLDVSYSRPRTMSRIAVSPPPDPGVAPTVAVIRADGEERRVRLDEFGTFEPLRAQRFAITFENPTRGARPIGMSELYLDPDGVTWPLRGARVTGAECGSGPALWVDGELHDTRVTGYVGDVLSAGPMPVTLCDGPVRLATGLHRIRLRSTPEFSVTVARLSPVAPGGADTSGEEGLDELAARASAARAGERVVGVDRRADDDITVRLRAGGESLLSTGFNVNRGWTATLNGEVLPPQVVDGWAQGWIVPQGAAGAVRLQFAPESAYVVFLKGGLVLSGLLVLVALVLAVRTRLDPPREPTDLPVRRRHVWVAWVAPALGWVLAGPLVGGCLALALVVRRVVSGRAVVLGAAGCLVAGVVETTRALVQGPRLVIDSADMWVGAAIALAVVVALGPHEGEPGR